MQNDDRTDDWNFYLARNLPPGQYRLQVDPVESDRAETTITMERPVDIQEKPITLPACLTITDTNLHTFPLQPAWDDQALPEASKAGHILLISAASDTDAWISLEQGDNGIWTSSGQSTGRNPVVAVVTDTDMTKKSYRLRIQSADRRSTAIECHALTLNPLIVDEDQLRQGVILPPIAGFEPPTGMTAVALKRPGLFQIESEQFKSLSWAGTGGQQLSGSGDRLMLAQGNMLWLMNTSPKTKIRATRVLLDDERILTMTLPSGLQPVIELKPHSGPVLVVAESRLGQPGIAPSDTPNTPMFTGIADGSAATVIEDSHITGARVQNAGDSSADLILNLKRYAFEHPVVDEMPWGMRHVQLTPQSGRVLRFPAGLKHIRMSLPPHTAALITEKGQSLGLHWAGENSLVKSVENSGEQVMLLYAGRDDACATVTVTPIKEHEYFEQLHAGSIFNRYFSAAGVFRLNVELSKQEKRTGIRLNLRGTDISAIFTAESGLVQTGSEIRLNEGGIVDITHNSGPVIAWLENGGQNPWLNAEQVVQVVPPSQVSMSGAAMTLNIESTTSSMMHLDAAVPMIVSLYPGTPAGRVEVYPNGGNLDICLPSGLERSQLTLMAIGNQPLTGNITVYATEITALDEGMGPEFRLGPGDSRLFRFTLWDDRTIGLGVSGSADVAACRLLDSGGRTVGTGIVQMHALKKGEYFLSVDLPAGAASVELRPVLVGIKKPEGPPPEVIQQYLKQSGLKYE